MGKEGTPVPLGQHLLSGREWESGPSSAIDLKASCFTSMGLSFPTCNMGAAAFLHKVLWDQQMNRARVGSPSHWFVPHPLPGC